ncbi:aminoglycoside phosphotransferase family protein [Amycolatopsis endophytica]|uniref:Streptomycin 6-kinase n=1 Tax=Amycolatopsis endophytica TaxID=860233 RepID=A0A853AXX4_9PSEU|nr:aminoglycoside phosphotransferase family protein [Amycolatopsis endophytica]NYI87487.1 streptomycin 6-kinase [Amycolatopsis endophytica]
MQVPGDFAKRLIGSEGDGVRPWLDGLPDLARWRCREWGLRIEGPPWHGHTALVFPVRRDGARAVLKLAWQNDDTRDEPVALSTWDGRGAVRLLESGHGTLLLERLDASRSLLTEPLDEAAGIASALLRRLTVPAPPLVRTLRAEAIRLATELPAEWARLGRPLPKRLLDAAVAVCRDLGPEAGSHLVNQDLHYENVLAGTREPWLVIDPQPIAGDPEYGVIPLLWNRFGESTVEERFAAVTEGLDADRARAWTLVRAVENWLWAVKSGGFPSTPILAAIAERVALE